MVKTTNRKSLLSSQARIQAPWIKVTIGDLTFGVFSNTKALTLDKDGFYKVYKVQYPNYVKSLTIEKINGQVNKYTLTLEYPVRTQDDPNFFEKVLAADSSTRKIIFSYGDASQPAYIYKDEEAIITKVSQQFILESSVIRYTINAVSGAALGKLGNFTFFNSGKKKPSDEIKKLFKNPKYKLRDLFTGMSLANIDALIAGDDKAVTLSTQTNISPLDYIAYLVSCMTPESSKSSDMAKDIYILTLHDDTIYDQMYNDTLTLGGPYFKVTRTSYVSSYSDAYEVDIGYNTSTIVTQFSLENNENYSMYYNYSKKLQPEEYKHAINSKGEVEEIFSPAFASKNEYFRMATDDMTWYTKITKYPINATITIQGLLRPATLMQYLRLNVIFPGGHKHISSGLYIVTKQVDTINDSGYRTTLSLTKIDGDDNPLIGETVELGIKRK